MHLNYHFLQNLAKEVSALLSGQTFVECYSQNKDELILALSNGNSSHYIRAYLSGSFSCLSFPTAHHRARRNSIDLFPEIIGKSVEGISIISNDRSFNMKLSSGYSLLFKLHGNRSNIILYQESRFLGMFNNALKKDEDITSTSIAKPGSTNKEEWLAMPDLRSVFPTFGPRVLQHLRSKGFENNSPEQQWSQINELLVAFKDAHFFINEENGVPFLSLFEQGNSLSQHQSAIEATNALSRYYHQTYLFEREKSKQLQQLKSAYQKAEKYIRNTEQKMELLLQKRPFDEIANIIMANLHAIPKGTSKVELLDFYTNELIEIKLKPDASPQKQAEQYYRKSKNQSKEKENLESNLRKKTRETEKLALLIDELSAISDRKSLSKFSKTNAAEQTNQKHDIRLPFYQHEIDGFEIRIGKSAKDNDLMLRQFAHKDDLWLHARDVAGSHVLIRHQKNQIIKPILIEQAAQLAAFYSKRKHDTLAPVIYTPRKFVRKAKNLLPGQVLVEKEQVILVKPSKEPNLSH